MIAHNVQETSIEAYRTSQAARHLLRDHILEYLGAHPGSTNREMEEALGIRGTSLTSAIHYLRGTDEVTLDITENKLSGRRKCLITKRHVMTWRRTHRPAKPFDKLKLTEVAHNDALNLADRITRKHLNAAGIGLDGNYGPILTAMLNEIAEEKIKPPTPKQPRERKEPSINKPKRKKRVTTIPQTNTPLTLVAS